VFKNLIVKPVYNRCEVGHHDMTLPNGKTKKSTFKKINFPAIVNLKADGTFRSCEIDNGASFLSRSGQPYTYGDFENALKNENGTLNGEMTVILDDELLKIILPKLEKVDKKEGTNSADNLLKRYNNSKELNQEFILDRGLGNGLLNSDDVPEKNIVYDVWDLITQEDVKLAAQKDKKNSPKESYKIRFAKLQKMIKRVKHPRIRLIEFKEVSTLAEAMEFTVEKMEMGLEGAILKDWDMRMKDGTNALQLKLKLKVDADVRVTGFIEGKKGTKRELTFGSLTFETDDGMIKGSTSGFNDELLEKINNNRDAWIGQIISVEFNDLSKGRGNTHYALSHPRFVELRNDKNETDTIERVLESVEMAKGLK
jgi:ATP-dependent DNA ligase